jgi:hypothetical protein
MVVLWEVGSRVGAFGDPIAIAMGFSGSSWDNLRCGIEATEKQKAPEIFEIPGAFAWWPYRDSNPSFSLERAAS